MTQTNTDQKIVLFNNSTNFYSTTKNQQLQELLLNKGYVRQPLNKKSVPGYIPIRVYAGIQIDDCDKRIKTSAQHILMSDDEISQYFFPKQQLKDNEDIFTKFVKLASPRYELKIMEPFIDDYHLSFGSTKMRNSYTMTFVKHNKKQKEASSVIQSIHPILTENKLLCGVKQQVIDFCLSPSLLSTSILRMFLLEHKNHEPRVVVMWKNLKLKHFKDFPSDGGFVVITNPLQYFNKFKEEFFVE